MQINPVLGYELPGKPSDLVSCSTSGQRITSEILGAVRTSRGTTTPLSGFIKRQTITSLKSRIVCKNSLSRQVKRISVFVPTNTEKPAVSKQFIRTTTSAESIALPNFRRVAEGPFPIIYTRMLKNNYLYLTLLFFDICRVTSEPD